MSVTNPNYCSSGPTTPEGKETASQNSLKHGCRAQARILPGESPERYQELWNTWLARYHPTTAADFELIRLTVDAAWRMERSQRVFEKYEAELFAFNPDPTVWDRRSGQAPDALTAL